MYCWLKFVVNMEFELERFYDDIRMRIASVLTELGQLPSYSSDHTNCVVI